MCFETSEVVERGHRCSLNPSLKGSCGFTNNCHSVFVGLKYVEMPEMEGGRGVTSRQVPGDGSNMAYLQLQCMTDGYSNK